jgi:hypothetical protein
MAGGFTADKPADDEIRALFEVDHVMQAVAGLLGHEVSSLTVNSYQTQVVRLHLLIRCMLRSACPFFVKKCGNYLIFMMVWTGCGFELPCQGAKQRWQNSRAHIRCCFEWFPRSLRTHSVMFSVQQATVNGDKNVEITAHKPLPHTGLPLEVKAAKHA